MRITPIIAALALAGCGLATSYQMANMTPAELTKVSDYDLCWHGSANNPAVRAERQKRDLADCSPAAQQCHAMGYRTGTEIYLQCRQIEAQKEAAQTAANAASSAAMLKCECNPAGSAATPTPASDADADNDHHKLQRQRQHAQLHEHAALIRT